MSASGPLTECWRGGVEAWECDEMGHMNVRFWVRRCFDGLTTLAGMLGLPDAFAPRAAVTLLPVDQHIRFLREAPAGMPLTLSSAVLEVGEAGLEVYSEIVQSRTGLPAATFITRLALVDPATGAAAPLPPALRAAALAMRVPLPEHGRPRSIPMSQPLPQASLARAQEAGFRRVGLFAVRNDEVDTFGRLYPEGMIGRVSQAVPNLLSGWREDVAAEAMEMDGLPRRAGAAVLEYRLQYIAWPGVGDLIEVRSGVVRIEDKTHALQHWLLDPRTGTPWCVSEAVAITFDLNSRKAMATPPRARAALEAMMVRP